MGGPANDIGIFRCLLMSRFTDGSPLRLHAAESFGPDSGGSLGKYPPGIGTVRAALAERHANSWREIGATIHSDYMEDIGVTIAG